MEIIEGLVKSPYVVLLYGTPGIGKSTAAKYSERPLFINLENGLDRVDTTKTPFINNYKELLEAFKFAAQSDYKTIVIDTAGALEQILEAEILKEFGNEHAKPQGIKDKDFFPFGLGIDLLRGKWGKMVKHFFRFKELGKNVIITSHERLEDVNNPGGGEDLKRIVPDIQRKCYPEVIRNLDAVLYMNYSRFISNKSGKKDIAIDKGWIDIITLEKSFVVAKNRFNLDSPIVIRQEQDIKELLWAKIS